MVWYGPISAGTPLIVSPDTQWPLANTGTGWPVRANTFGPTNSRAALIHRETAGFEGVYPSPCSSSCSSVLIKSEAAPAGGGVTLSYRGMSVFTSMRMANTDVSVAGAASRPACPRAMIVSYHDW